MIINRLIGSLKGRNLLIKRAKISLNKEMKELAANLRGIHSEVEFMKMESNKELFKQVPEMFKQVVELQVYKQYTPAVYKRTRHLGGQGSQIQNILNRGSVSSYEFYIDEDSRDPVDGSTWRDKANKVESGNMEGANFPRPFIDEAQQNIELIANVISERFINDVKSMIDKL